jgi:hypothetical protein
MPFDASRSTTRACVAPPVSNRPTRL